MKQIQLTQGQVALVDDEDYDFLSQWKWFAAKQKDGAFYARRSCYETGSLKNVMMHRVVLRLVEEYLMVDHKDHNRLNNQKDNLRACTSSQNQSNQSSHSDSSSKYVGVTFHKSTGKWQSQIKKGGKYKYIGLFESEQHAALAYNEKAVLLHGEFANLNKVAI